MTPAGWKHGSVGGKLGSLMGRHVLEENLGRVFLAETGFLLARDPDTVRAPDIAFIHKDRLPVEEPTEAFWPGAPDLAVEVVSPGDTVGEVDEKIKAWLDAGAMMVWVVDPQGQHIAVYRSATDITMLTMDDELDGQEVLPGFRCRVEEIFAHL